MSVGATVIVLSSAYAVFLGVLASSWRHPSSGDRARPGVGLRGLLAHALRTAVGGYIAFLVIVLVFQVWIVGQRQALPSAARGGGFLTAVAVPVFVVACLVFDRPGRP